MKQTVFKSFSIIGGDKRQLFLARELCDSGYKIFAAGFDGVSAAGIVFTDVKTAVKEGEAVILPVPCLRADRSLNTPFSREAYFLSDSEISKLIKKPCFAGMSSRLIRAYPVLSDAGVYDYAAREDFAVLNALPTAEGALELALRLYEGTLSGSKALVAGFGRIGKLLAGMLKRLDSRVTISARKPEDFAYASALGYSSLNTESLSSVKGFDIVFNTVPDMIFDYELLKNTDKNTLIIDLASLPGGVDLEAAAALGIDARRALALPGKCAPKAAGRIIGITIEKIIEEVYR